MLAKRCAVILLVALVSCAIPKAQGATIDERINQVYGKPTTLSPSTTPLNLQPYIGELKPSAAITGTDGCTCVSFYLCNNGSINTSGEGIIDIRIDQNPCGHYLFTCCDKKNQVVDPITPAPPAYNKTGCGYRNVDGVGFRITGNKDNEAEFAEFPWMVALFREETVDGKTEKLDIYHCGGALIHPQAVVTAAHCVSGNRQFKIRAGEWDTKTRKELYPHQDSQVESIVAHPQYYAGGLFNDIAVLFLKTPVNIAENVNVICLPPQGAAVDNSRCYASGWGKDAIGKQDKNQDILKKIDLPIVPRDTCQQQLRKTKVGPLFELHNSFICAGGEPGKDTCNGDGGSPLVCPIAGEKERYFQAGIVAWGIGCGENDTPGVYVNLALFRNWIDEQLQIKGMETSIYQY